MTWLQGVFSEGDTGSFARVSSGFLTFIVAVWGSFFLYVHRAFPDVGTIGVLTAFMTAPYAYGKVASVISPQNPPPSAPK